MRSSAGFALLALCGNVLGACLAIPEVRKLELVQREAKPELDKRITCIEDDYLLSFQMYIEDSYPSCSAYLGIPETTTFTTETARTTVVVLQTTYQTFQQQITIPAGTTTVTRTVPNTPGAPTFKKRQNEITPAAVVFSECAEATGLNASLIHSVSSACSCLFITEKINVVVTTTTETRTEPGIDYIQTTEIDTVTGPETTVYYTVKPTTFMPYPNMTASSTGSLPSPTFSTGPLNPGSLSSSSLSSSGTPVSSTTEIPTAPPASSSFPAPSSNGTSVLPLSTPSNGFPISISTPFGTSFPFSSTGPIGSPSISGGGRSESGSSASSSTPTSSPSASGPGKSTAIPIPTSSVSSGLPPSSSLNASTVSSPNAPSASSVQPPPSSIPVANSSVPVGTNTGVPTSASSVFSTTTLLGSTTTVVGPSTGILSASGNTTATSSFPIGSPTIPTGPRGGSSITPSGSASSIITPTKNSTFLPSPTNTTGPPIASNCPADNGTIYTSQCQNFLIECYINYGGPVNQGLVERSLYGCVDDCAIANVGFSQSRCYAASYFPNIIGPNCFFKTQQSSLTPFDNEMTISALLLNPSSGNSSTLGCNFPTSTSNTTSKPTLSTGGTSVSIPSATDGSVTLSSKAATTNGTSIPSPSFSSAPASGSISATANGTSVPSPSFTSAPASGSLSAPTNGTTSVPHPSFSSAPASGSAPATTNGTSYLPSSSFSSAPTSGSTFSSLGNGTIALSTGTAPLSSSTIPKASSNLPFSTGTVPTVSTSNSTIARSTGHTSKTVPSFSISRPSESRINNLSMNGTTETPPATSCLAQVSTSYVYSTSVIYITSVI